MVSAQSSPVAVIDINQQIKDKKSKISDIKKKIEIYQKNIKSRQAEKASLENEIEIIEDQVNQKTLAAEAMQDEIDQLQLESQQAGLELEQKELEISTQKERLAEYVRKLYENSQRDVVETFLLNENFSDFYDSMKYLEQAQTEVAESLQRIKLLREQLTVQKSSLDNNEKRQKELKEALEQQKQSLEEHKSSKQNLIVQSVLSAEKFKELLNNARSEQQEIDSDVARLERTVREKLKLHSTGTFALSWPVDPGRGISAYFHDTTYPFRYVFEHPAIDVRAYQGTPLKAAEDGYVGRAKDGGRGYSYIMLLHDKGIATVYGHVSRILVAQDTYVQKGQIIGLSGGAPGSSGAGPFTTGPHLHFEVRVNGIPDNPLKYLP